MARARDAAMPETVALPTATTALAWDIAQPANFPLVTERLALRGLEVWWAVASECQREMADFVTKRLEKDSEAIRDALAVKDLTDATTLQARWVQQMMDDYAAETSKLLSIYSKHGASQSAAPALH
jgi:hypothetical protein